MNIREKLFLLLFVFAGAVLCYFVVATKGMSQVGNAFSFLGGIATLIPPLNQLRSNQSFIRAISIPAHPDLAGLDEELEQERRRNFMSFKPFDFVLVVSGILLMSSGFLISILTSSSI